MVLYISCKSQIKSVDIVQISLIYCIYFHNLAHLGNCLYIQIGVIRDSIERSTWTSIHIWVSVIILFLF